MGRKQSVEKEKRCKQLRYYYRKKYGAKLSRPVKESVKEKVKESVKELSTTARVVENSILLPSKPSLEKRQFLHKLTRVYPLIMTPGQALARLPQARQWTLTPGNEQRLGIFENVSFVVTTRSIEVIGIQLYGTLKEPSRALLARGEAKADAVIDGLEKEYGALVQRGANGELLGRTSWLEIALTDTEGARHLTDRHAGKIVLYEAPRTHKKLYADRTPTPASFEAESAMLMDLWRRGLVIPLEKGKWNAPAQLELNAQVTNMLQAQARINDQTAEAIARIIDMLAKERGVKL